MINRVIWIILDSVGIGELPDASDFGDNGSNTLSNLNKIRPLNIPNLTKLGIGNIDLNNSLAKIDNPIGGYGKMNEISKGKDTTIGHWEMAGIYSKIPFPTFPNGFPKEIISSFEEKIGRKTIGNKVASGTEILVELGEEHIKTGCPIIYTSADSVFQIACHEEIISLEELYKMCKIAREMFDEKIPLGRIIARPFVGDANNFQRTSNRRDFSLQPPENTILDNLVNKGFKVIGIGKIEDIFDGRGISEAIHTHSNLDGINKTLDYMKSLETGLIFTNLVDFDSKWGHRNDIEGYASGLEVFDVKLKDIIDASLDNDLIIINADHGCDPTTESTDHSREYVPLIVYSKSLQNGVNLGIRETFADVGQTIAEIFKTDNLSIGTSFLNKIILK